METHDGLSRCDRCDWVTPANKLRLWHMEMLCRKCWSVMLEQLPGCRPQDISGRHQHRRMEK